MQHELSRVLADLESLGATKAIGFRRDEEPAALAVQVVEVEVAGKIGADLEDREGRNGERIGAIVDTLVEANELFGIRGNRIASQDSSVRNGATCGLQHATR